MMEPMENMDAELLPVVVKKMSKKRVKSADPIMCGLVKSVSEYTKEELVPSVADSLPQENVGHYAKGGFMRVVLGQPVGAFKVVRKLGHGAFSTVWMGVDLYGRREYAAIKIGKSSRRGFESLSKEVAIMKKLLNQDPDHPGYEFVMKFCYEMHMHSSYGKHVVFVMDTVGRSLFEIIQEAAGRGINADAARNISKQILLGITYLHEACRMIHTDLKPANVIVKCSQKYLDNMYDKVKRYQDLGLLLPSSYITAIEYAERKAAAGPDVPAHDLPKYLRRPGSASDVAKMAKGQVTYGPMLVSPDVQVKISDMGNAVAWEPRNHGMIQTSLYRSLEVYLTEQFDYSADIWSAGCIMFELMTGTLLFGPTAKGGLSAHDHILLMFQMLKGVIPIYVRSSGVHAPKYFHPDGSLKRMAMVEKMETPQEILVNYMNWPKAQAEVFGNLILTCINPDPDARETAAMILKHKWFAETDWI